MTPATSSASSNGAGRLAPCSSNRLKKASPTAVVESLVIVTWNVHVGGGDIEDVVARLRRGEFTEGRSVPHFVLLLQEAHREGSDVPADVPAGSPVPRPIVERPPNGERRDIRSVARSERLHVLYAPAMRNGTTAVPEDRGTAILSTLPLANLQVIELPFERQRRVALAATVAGETPSGAPWQLRLAAVQHGHVAGAHARRPLRCAATAGGGAGRGARK